MKNYKQLLTIGIPTYNRSDTINKCIETLTKLNLHEIVNILVIDNNSEDNTYQLLKNKFSGKLLLYKNNTNIGFAKSTIEIFKKCNSKYLLWMSDEDSIKYDTFIEFLNFLKNKDYYFICSQFYINQRLIRGSLSSTRIKENSLWDAAAHMPGLVFETQETINFFNKNVSNEYDYPNVFKYYPQLLIVIFLITKDIKKCVYYNNEICFPKFFLKQTHLLGIYGDDYAGVSLRWQIHKESINYMNYLLKLSPNSPIINKIITSQKKRTFMLLRYAVLHESEDLIHYFDKETFFFVFLFIFRKIKIWLLNFKIKLK